MRLDDALFYWLQMKLVADARPDDAAAQDTWSFFAQILAEDHHITSVQVERQDDSMIYVRYEREQRSKLQMFPREAAEQLLTDINSNPKYNS